MLIILSFATVVIMSIPDRTELAVKNLYNVKEVRAAVPSCPYPLFFFFFFGSFVSLFVFLFLFLFLSLFIGQIN